MVPANVRGLRIGHLDPVGLFVFLRPETEQASRYGSPERPFTGHLAFRQGVPRGHTGGFVVPEVYFAKREQLFRAIRYNRICQELHFKSSYLNLVYLLNEAIPILRMCKIFKVRDGISKTLDGDFKEVMLL